MTVVVEISRTFHTGVGTLTVYAIPFRLVSADDLRVTRVNTAGVESTLVKGTHYTVQGVGSPTGTVTLLDGPLASGFKLILERVMPVLQGTDLRSEGQFLPESIEDELDRMSMRIQQLESLLQTRSPGTARVPILRIRDTSGVGAFRALGHRIANVADPVDAQDAATKAWVSSQQALSGIVKIDAVYTTATRPAANSLPGYLVRIKDTNAPERWQASIRNASGTYEWQDVVMGGLG